MRRNRYRQLYKDYVKRSLDVIVSCSAIVLLSPVLLTIALLVRMKLGSPVLFKQRRPGLHERLFTLYKFRTMTEESDENGALLPDEQRLTRFGRVLRSTSLDELPELLNVLKGDMSIVGPRPLLVRYLPYYTQEERLRHTVRPGLTGLAQISGRNVLEWDRRLARDVEYVRNLSFLVDVKIIFLTIKKVIQRADITVGNGHVLKNLDIERKMQASERSGTAIRRH